MLIKTKEIFTNSLSKVNRRISRKIIYFYSYENGTCTRREWHFGWAKVALAHPKTTFLWFSRRTARAKMRCLLCFFLQNGCSGRGCLNNICIASYGVGAKFFTTNLMGVDLLQNTPKTRKPIAERTSHGWHGYTHQGVQQSLLHQTTATPPTECTERTEPSGREEPPADEHRSLVGALETSAPPTE